MKLKKQSSVKKVLQIDDKIEQAYINIGNAYVNIKKPKEGIPYLREAKSLNPGIASIHTNLR